MAQDHEAPQELLRRIPAVDQILLQPSVASWVRNTSHSFVVAEIQELLRELRETIRSGRFPVDTSIDPAHLGLQLEERLQQRLRPALATVINATGVILHTNLGRAPLSAAAQESLSAVSGQYTNLEYDVRTGARSHRDQLIEPLLKEVLRCEAATVVNNNAAAVFLILDTLAAGREVVVSRGELVEIGGSFRIPEILAHSGARLREVGTTNKTRIRDYEAAIGPDTALLLRVHPSNYRVRGFSERPDLADLVALAHRHQLPLAEDIGSGCLLDLRPYGIADEPRAQDSVAAGVDLVCFSADKLLGGPQAGVIAGSQRWIDLIRTNPLMRTYRVEKLIYGALEATLASYRNGQALNELPVLRMLAISREALRRRSRRFLGRLRPLLPEGTRAVMMEGNSVVGGGSCPDTSLATVLLAIESDRRTPNDIEQRLRAHHPPILVRLENDRALLDLRTVFPAQEKILLAGLQNALEGQ
jgi:L-seryl-tRNA(Ser) seleniumtransferase